MLDLGYQVESDAQLRQWRHGYSGRRPSPVNCVAIERATDAIVTRKDLRPDDWHLIWPELVGIPSPISGTPEKPGGTTSP